MYNFTFSIQLKKICAQTVLLKIKWKNIPVFLLSEIIIKIESTNFS